MKRFKIVVEEQDSTLPNGQFISKESEYYPLYSNEIQTNEIVKDLNEKIRIQQEINSRFEVGDRVKAWRHTQQSEVEGVVVRKYPYQSYVRTSDNDSFYCYNTQIKKLNYNVTRSIKSNER